MSNKLFFKEISKIMIPQLPKQLQTIQVRQPWGWLVQFHFGEPYLHYEVSLPGKHLSGLEIGLHFESRDAQLNRYLLRGFRRHLFEIKTILGQPVEAEMWTHGWSKIYEIHKGSLTDELFKKEIATRTAFFIEQLHPIFLDLRADLARFYK